MSRSFQAVQKVQSETDAQGAIPLKAPQPVGNAASDSGSLIDPIEICALPFRPLDKVRQTVFPAPSSEAAEQYRVLRARILQRPQKPRFLVVSSPTAGDGKTTTAVNLAWALAEGGENSVLLVEADLRRSSLHEQIGIRSSPGLAELAAGECQLPEALSRFAQFPNLYVLPAGKAKVNAAEVLSSRRWAELCALFRSQFTFVIADSPPIGAGADHDLIQAVCDGVLLVLRPDHTKRKLLADALTKISQPKLLGILLNSVPQWFMWKHNYYDFYRS